MIPAKPSFSVSPDRCHFTLTLDGRRPRLHARHRDQAAAFAALRALEELDVPCLAVRLDEDYAQPVTILRACGVNPDGLEHDLTFRAAVIRACLR